MLTRSVRDILSSVEKKSWGVDTKLIIDVNRQDFIKFLHTVTHCIKFSSSTHSGVLHDPKCCEDNEVGG